jgi:beta-N-acetylhexosaminidase
MSRVPLLALVLAAAVLAAAVPDARAAPGLRRLVGQRLIVAMTGTSPSRDLRLRVRRGEVGGVILFGSNVRSRAQVAALTRALRRAARRGGQPLPLVMTDQEGGAVKRLPWAPPTLSAPEIGARDRSAVAHRQGRATGRALGALGIDCDLAPVADVPRLPDSFIALQGRAYSRSRYVVARMAAAFSAGLGDGGVAATVKHFPGLGRATVSTDEAFVRIDASRRAIVRDLLPFHVSAESGAPMVMLSTAVYPRVDFRAAAWSPVFLRMLRHRAGFRGVTITDSLDSAAAVRGTPLTRIAQRAARAGTDLILVTGSAAASQAVYATLLRAASRGVLARTDLEASYRRILALKRRFP